MNLKTANLSQLLYIARFTNKTAEAHEELKRRIINNENERLSANISKNSK